jgi:hypothetical protein
VSLALAFTQGRGTGSSGTSLTLQHTTLKFRARPSSVLLQVTGSNGTTHPAAFIQKFENSGPCPSRCLYGFIRRWGIQNGTRDGSSGDYTLQHTALKFRDLVKSRCFVQVTNLLAGLASPCNTQL